MRLKKFCAGILAAGLMMTSVPVSALAATIGWQGSDAAGWRYYTTTSEYVTSDWKQIGGKWYYFDASGYMESDCYRDGCYLTKSGEWDKKYSHGTWKNNSNGWWYEDNGWYPVSRWLWIDGQCYYFDSKGFMESDCYRDGCYLAKNGAWDKRYSHGAWKNNSNGWWYEDNGWYPVSRWLWIDGQCYYFDAKGFMESDCYRDGCYLSKSGAWDKRYSHGTWKSNSKGKWYEDNGWYPRNCWLTIDGTSYYFGADGYVDDSAAAEPDVTGIYVMKAQTEQQKNFAAAFRLELLRKDGRLGVLFTYIYDTNEDNYRVYFVDSETEGGKVTASWEGEWEKVELSADGKTVDVDYQWLDGNINEFSGHYERITPLEYTPDPTTVPEPVLDPNTPGGSVDAALAKAARRDLGLPADAVLTEALLAQVTSIELYSEKNVSMNGLEYFTGVRYFISNGSALTDISPLGNITTLEEIVIIDAQIATIPDLSKCKNLRVLSLDYCRVSDLSPVNKIKSLESLGLSYNRITSIAPIKDNDTIEILNLYGNTITDWDVIAGNEKLLNALNLGYDYEDCISLLNNARAILKEIITDDMSDLEKEIAIYKKVQEMAVYDMKVRDLPDKPEGYYVLMEGFGICGDYAEAISLLMNLAGLECFEVISEYNPDYGPDTHAWNIVKIDGEYYEIDCTSDDLGEPMEWKYFNVSRQDIDTDPMHHLNPVPDRLATHTMMRLEYLWLIN